MSDKVEKLKGRSSRLLLQEFSELNKRYWGRHFRGAGYGAWSSGDLTQDMIDEYLDHHCKNPNSDENFILE